MKMTRTIGPLVLVAALGIVGGVLSWRSPSLARTIQAGAAILIGGNLLLMRWLWSRARPGSGDALVLPGIMLLSVSMLIGLVPRLFWPANERLLMGASVVSIVLTVVVVITTLRLHRKFRAARR